VSFCSNTKLRAFYGKWIEALFTYDVDVLEEYLKASTSSGSAAPVSAVLRPAKVCLYETFTVAAAAAAAAAVVVVVVVLVALEEYLKASTSSGSVACPAKVCQPHMSSTAQ